MMALADQEIGLGEALAIAVDHHSRGELAQAQHIYRKVISVDDRNADAVHLLGVTYYQQQKLDEAAQLIRQAIGMVDTIGDYHSNLGVVLHANGEHRDAIAAFRRAVELDPTNAESLNNLANSHTALKEYDRAASYYVRALRLKPEFVDAHYNLGNTLRRAGNLDAAVAALGRARELAPGRADVYCSLADCLTAMDRLDEAETLLSTSLALDSHLIEAHLAQAHLRIRRKQYTEAVDSALAAYRIDSESAETYYTLGSAYWHAGVPDGAVENYRRCLLRDPDNFDALNNLAVVLRTQDRLDEAESCFERAIELRIDEPEPYKGLAEIYRQRGDLEAAQENLERAASIVRARLAQLKVTALGDDTPYRRLDQLAQRLDRLQALEQISNELSTLYKQMQLPNEGIRAALDVCAYLVEQVTTRASLRSARSELEQTTGEDEPDGSEEAKSLRTRLYNSVHAANALLSEAGRRFEAIEILRQAGRHLADHKDFLNLMGVALLGVGDPVSAEVEFRKAEKLAPEDAGVLNNLGLSLQAQHRDTDSIECLQKAVKVSPKYAEAWSHLGSAWLNLGELNTASECFEKSVALKPSSAEAWNNIALVYQSLCRFDEAIDCLRQTRALAPTNAAMHSNLLFGLQYQPGKTAKDLYEETMAWGEAHAAPHYAKAKPLTNSADPEKRLRIGYMGPDFKGHSSAYFLLPLFENHDRDAFEIFVYGQVAPPDGWTQKFMDLCHNWHFTNALTNDALADLIRSERIDILVDLGAHTADARALVAAQKPAPVQVSWIGLGNTTGVKTIDYFLTDPHYVPADHEQFFCEKPWRLPRIAYCYDPLNVFPDVGPQPALEKGYVTFGCFSRSVRMNPTVLETWAKLMVAVPNSQILINTKSMLDHGLRHTFHETFARHGVARDRVRLEFITPTQETWAAYNQVDIALDPFPHNAGLTSYEALWMGVPVLTLKDRPPQGRYGTSIMNNIGLPEFVAEDPADYVRIGTEFARAPERLAALRKDLRERMKKSPLCDGHAFARDVEEAYRGMWRRWCAEQNAV